MTRISSPAPPRPSPPLALSCVSPSPLSLSLARPCVSNPKRVRKGPLPFLLSPPLRVAARGVGVPPLHCWARGKGNDIKSRPRRAPPRPPPSRVTAPARDCRKAPPPPSSSPPDADPSQGRRGATPCHEPRHATHCRALAPMAGTVPAKHSSVDRHGPVRTGHVSGQVHRASVCLPDCQTIYLSICLSD